jgi:hypothetical protein
MKKTLPIALLAALALTALYADPSSGDLVGIWTATIENNQSYDDYRIDLTADGRCTVKVSNDSADQETTGNWSYDSGRFTLNATFRNAKLSYLPNIQWISRLSFTADNNAFNILGKTAANGTQARITFFRQNGVFNQEAFNPQVIPQIFAALSADIPARLRIAIVGIDSPNPEEAAFYLNELTMQFVNSKNYTVVERSDIDAVFKEQHFQMSYVDENAMLSIGKFFEANVIIFGSITGTGSQKRLIIKAINVLTSEILSMPWASL